MIVIEIIVIIIIINVLDTSPFCIRILLVRLKKLSLLNTY